MAGCSEHFIQSPYIANRHPEFSSGSHREPLMGKDNVSPRTDAEQNSA